MLLRPQRSRRCGEKNFVGLVKPHLEHPSEESTIVLLARAAITMSFRKRNVVISQKGDSPVAAHKETILGTRPSPVTGHTTTSTGTESLDKLLGLGAGLALGTSLMIEEEGTTEFARSLLSCYAAEGVLQGHVVFVVGPPGSMTLPGLVEDGGSKSKEKTSVESERMKIAWRYERLGAFEDRERGGSNLHVACPMNEIHLSCAFITCLVLTALIQVFLINKFHLRMLKLPANKKAIMCLFATNLISPNGSLYRLRCSRQSI